MAESALRTANAGEKHVGTRYEAIQRVRTKFIAAGKVRVIDVSCDEAYDTMVRILNERAASRSPQVDCSISSSAGKVTAKLSLLEFGEKLITTCDLDPLYVALIGAKLPTPQLHRWLLAYWMFYHVGVASWLSGENEFWRWATVAASNAIPPPVLNSSGRSLFRRWPRGSERRHFRGLKAVKAVNQMERSFPKPENAIDSLRKYDIAEKLMKEVQTWPMFGKWISFKAVDMLDRVAGWRIPIPADVVFMYDALARLRMRR
jgi:hypothetical protein